MSGYYDRSGKYHRPGSASRSDGWWTYAAPRPSNGIGISPEMPTGRAVAWNVGFVAAEVIGAVTAHVAFGVPWWPLVLGFAAVLVLGGSLLLYAITVATPRALRRHETALRAHLPAHSARVEGASPGTTNTTTTSTTRTGRAA